MITNAFLPTFNGNYSNEARSSFFNRFMAWCSAQEHDRMLWQAIILSIHGCVLTPIVLMLSLLAGTDTYLYIPVIVAMAINLVPNLAALSTKITIPVFFFSILMDLGVIVAVVAW